MRDVRSTRLHAFAKGTHSNLRTQFRCYFGFCVYFHRHPLPTTIDTICGYVQFLSRSITPPSIRNYLSGVKMLHIFLGYEYRFSENFHLRLTVRGIERIHQHVPRRAKPITPSILLAIQKLSSSFNSLQHAVFACGLLLFFSMARAGSILPASSKTPAHLFLTRQRLNMFSEGILITLIHTKTIQFGKRRLHIPLLSSPSPLCPVAAFLASSSLLPTHQATPAFVFMDRGRIKWLTQSIFINVFRRLVARAGIPDPSGFTGHSFRRGGASWAFQAGMPGELIQICGDWSSDAYKKYLEFSMQNRVTLAALLMRDLPC